ncbi:MAG: hypothetical protein H6843_12045 [Rhodospirillaceae bacterium]|nr:hypothetical protein [Rhodospirillaceae bacterium]
MRKLVAIALCAVWMAGTAAAQDGATGPGRQTIYERLGLDLSTPQSAAAAFLAAVEAADGLEVYVLLDPQSRLAIADAWRRLNLAPLLGREVASEEMVQMFDDLAELNAEESIDGSNGYLVLDVFSMADALFRLVARQGGSIVPLPGHPQIAGGTQFRAGEDGEQLGDVLVTGEGEDAVIHLMRSVRGHWRVLGVTRGTGDGAVTWLRSEPR